MSHLEGGATDDGPSKSSRKRKAVSQEIEIDVEAPEPPSKKASRKAKRAKSGPIGKSTGAEQDSGIHDGEKENANRGRSAYGIWIGNLSFSTTEQELQMFITSDDEYPIARAEITRIHLPLNAMGKGSKSQKSQNKGFAYIDFSTPKAAENALQLSEKLLTGRRVLIKSSRDFEGRPEKSQSNGTETKTAPSKRVFLGNLAFDITKADLETHFEVCGPIVNVQVATFEDSGKCKGYAWIDFDDVTSAAAAVRGWVESSTADRKSEQGKAPKRRFWVNKIKGRKLRAEFAEDKTTRYNKRFGKTAHNAASLDTGEEAPGSIQAGNGGQTLELDVERQSATGKRDHRQRSGRYDEATMVKLTGAIVDAQGKKTKFE